MTAILSILFPYLILIAVFEFGLWIILRNRHYSNRVRIKCWDLEIEANSVEQAIELIQDAGPLLLNIWESKGAYRPQTKTTFSQMASKE